MQKKPRRRILTRILWGVALVLVLAVVGVVAWSQIGVMVAEPEPLAEVRDNPDITVTDAPEGIVLEPADGASDVGLVFIPGAKVDPWGYAALLQGLAEDGVTVVITRPWLNLAFFDPRGLDSFTSAAPDVDAWAVGGHSLGGVRACQLAPDADALVLFASYCANDLSDSDLPVLSLSGSEDGLSTPEKIEEARPQLPADAKIVQIDGASHASFGDYGPQAGDGTPSISDEDMRAEVTDEVDGFLQTLVP
ncbi:alpha/beta hydrolase [Microbacterium sp. p3-SID336]|uniref:alpha/beta hydrolase n=1 Tax=Microbacterium sp. p3-SID336 TaxID=2916212 RepID=UPI0021A74F35|nr:alpha/beta hydrolase [Microbacterium sp. p3-SID336]MCT1477970.1 alpha/beta hydrolase [Microbacterium sp. p3-SID336]